MQATRTTTFLEFELTAEEQKKHRIPADRVVVKHVNCQAGSYYSVSIAGRVVQRTKPTKLSAFPDRFAAGIARDALPTFSTRQTLFDYAHDFNGHHDDIVEFCRLSSVGQRALCGMLEAGDATEADFLAVCGREFFDAVVAKCREFSDGPK